MSRRQRAERLFAAALIAFSAALHLLFWRAAGALWRDELVSVRVALSPTFAELRSRLHLESFGALWIAVLRGWLTVASDARLLGLLIGLALLAALWLAARAAQAPPPIVALAVVGYDAAVIRYGDSIRGYRLGAIAGVALLAAMLVAITRGTRRAYVVATLVAVASVQTTYYDAVLLFVCCVVAAALLLRDRGWAEAWKPIAVGAVAAITLLPYLPAMRERASWAAAEWADVDAALYARRAFEALAGSGSAAAIIFLLACVAAVVAFVRKRGELRTWYAGSILVAWPIAHFFFVAATHYFPQPWHFSLLIVVMAWCADVLLAEQPALRYVIAAVAAAVALAIAPQNLSMRQTNVDAAAALIAGAAQPGDFVVVYPWYLGLPFQAYYRGSAAWMTLPPLADPAQRYDLFVRKLHDPNAGAPAAAAAAEALRRGHRVWLVGFPLGVDRAAMDRADAPWCAALAGALQRHARKSEIVLRPDPATVPYERVGVALFSP